MDKRDILICVSLFFVAFLIRVAGVSNVYMYLDEWIYWSYTNKILASNWAPTKDVFSCGSPFLSYIGAVVTVLFGGDLNNLRMISVIFGSLTVPALYLFGKAIYDRKTGLLSALFLCFSAYHCLYSRTIMLEAFTLFFVTAFLYFFWLSQHSDDRKSTTYAIIAGAMLGLAIAAKYLPIFLIPAVLAYVLWTKRFRFKALLDKQIVLMLIFAFFFFSPMLICLLITGSNPVYTYAIDIPESRAFVLPRGWETAPGGLFVTGVEQITEILAWDAERLIPLWTTVFELPAILLFLITIFSYLPNVINREKEASFLLISILSLYMFILAFIPAKYYLMHSFPLYFVMLSHLAVKSFEYLRKESNYKNIFRIFVISLIVVMLFSYFITGITSPYLGKTEDSWVVNAVDYIKSDVIKSGYAGRIVIGRIAFRDIIEYSIYLSGLNASSTVIVKPEGEYEKKVELDFEKINNLKPDYLIMSESQYNFFVIEPSQKEIFDNYRNVFHSKTYHTRSGHAYAGFVLKRKNMQSSDFLSPIDGKGGEISQDIFKRSVPGVMKVGKPYTVLVQVKNTGDSRTNFIARVYSEKFIIYGDAKEMTLNKGSTRILELKIVPFKEHVGELPVTVDLYARNEENETWKKVDSVSDYVYLIKK